MTDDDEILPKRPRMGWKIVFKVELWKCFYSENFFVKLFVWLVVVVFFMRFNYKFKTKKRYKNKGKVIKNLSINQENVQSHFYCDFL